MKVTSSAELATALKMKREEMKISQRNLMKVSGVGNATISRMESGELRNIQADTIFALLNALHIEMDLSETIAE